MALKDDWYQYYSEKRIVHQWFQVMMLKDLPVETVLEIGPYLGVPTALMATLGYKVTTLDILPRELIGAKAHMVADLEATAPKALEGFDCILCCEVLEHFPFTTSAAILNMFAETKTPYLVMSVPYQGFQIAFSAYLNLFTARKRTSFKYRNAWRRFLPGPKGSHQWEVGYKGYSLSKLEDTVRKAGWNILRRDFTGGTRSVFLLAKNTSV